MRMPDSPVQYELLGLVRVSRPGQQLIPGPPMQTALLAALLLRTGTWVERADLIRSLWGDAPPSGAHGLVATYAARLRKILEPDRPRRTAPRLLLSRGAAYGLQAAPDDADLWRFHRALTQARRTRDTHPAAARSAYRCALAEWHGHVPLLAVPGPLALVERHRLTGMRLSAQLELAELDVQLGAPGEAAEALEALGAENPHHERLYGLWMLALYREGRTAEALAVYQRIRRSLVRDLGVDPGPILTTLQSRILHAAPAPGSSRAVPGHGWQRSTAEISGPQLPTSTADHRRK
ncbi:AfsR/SARP family transcriptional regulator [Streptomyces luteolifulvus]|jgi:DNA-binding SARP family transcriptional activator|uniref:AfsR/SARP family transcriptional regulator n=1 Tax=Streptomyces luteolifulvus TaxID=2615112 RepID=A0A6H9US92_9ACTN|nr:AfsR/SARP family transcriptional regulator [Streptomyces luteolifulvus]KAB1141277.1 AfsR/SARP family transcriptional regulator [Streptomyces luteolifulvus]